MANRITQCDLGKSAPRKLTAGHFGKARPNNDFAPLGQLAVRPTADDALKRKRNNGAAGRGPFALLDINKSQRYKLGLMMQWAKVALALVVIFTIAYILITADPTDDVDGVLGPNHPASAHRMLAVSLWEFQTPVSVLLHLFTFTDRSQHLATLELLDVISVCRC